MRSAGYAVASVVQRVGGHEYRLRVLRDRQQYADPEGMAARAGIPEAAWPIFGVLWPAGIALAREMESIDIQGRRILEIGCGIALPSLVLARRGAEVTASDHHPLAEEFLRFNAGHNRLPEVRFALAPWAGRNAALSQYELLIGADLLYERGQPELLARFIAAHAAPAAQVLVADPGRRQVGAFIRLMHRHGFRLAERSFGDEDGGRAARGRMLDFTR